jgi:hypothetical protein
MKIGLVGPQESGKTVYFTGLAYRFGDEIGFGELSPKERSAYRRLKVKQRVGIQVSFTENQIQTHLQKGISFLQKLPFEDSNWSVPTRTWNNTELSCVFRFQEWKVIDTQDNEHIDDEFTRIFDIYDPAGGAISGLHDSSDEIIDVSPVSTNGTDLML